MSWTAAIGTIGNIVGNIMEGPAKAEAAMQSRHQAKREWNEKLRIQREREAAYKNLIAKGGVDQTTGEQQFVGETGAAVPEMQAARDAVLSGRAEGLNQAQAQLSSDLVKGGVRGGQAANQLRRQSGQMGIETQRMLDQMALDDAQRRQQERSQYYSGKAARGQAATYTQPTF